MNIQYKNLSKAEALIIDWQYGKDLGSFQRALVEALSIADTGNHKRLAKGFPEEAEAMDNFHHKSGWWPAVEVKAGLLDPDWEEKFNQRQLKLKEA